MFSNFERKQNLHESKECSLAFYQKKQVKYINNSLHLARKYYMLGYLSADIICPEKKTVFRERSSRKTLSFEEQIMSKEYPSIFSQPH